MPPTIKPQNNVSLSETRPTKIVFGDDGDIVETKQPEADLNNSEVKEESGAESEEDYYTNRERLKQNQRSNEKSDAQKKWFNVYPQYPTSEEILDLKENEQMELFNVCRSSFQSEMTNTFNKRNPSDARWLQTALHKGTAKDRANAGGLLVTSNPLGNLEALTALISFTKPSNKSSTEVIGILTDLWKEVLLPPHRKLVAVQARGTDWKLLRKNTSSSEMTKEQQRRILAYWHFENELKEQYFEFLKNLQLSMQTGQENNKNASIVAAAQLLSYAPEKEQMLLSMLINKLGDPIPKIASKALHHLTMVAHKHPNMCGVIVAEAEKLLFRNNISERAQHFALCFLASIAPAGRPEVCTKLVNICFALFKVLVQRGAINNRTMQAILRCLQKAILEAQPEKGSSEILNKDMQDTIYRLVHLADIRVSVQTLGLLLQLITVRAEQSDRFYNALYKKLLDLELINIGTKTAGHLLHIVHRAIHVDKELPRVLAFIKRLLQLALYMPPNVGAGCLIVINKLLRMRKDLHSDMIETVTFSTVVNSDKETPKNKEQTNESRKEKQQLSSSNDFLELVNRNENKTSSSYDPFHRVPTYAGAKYALRNELLLLREHFHPTLQVFADSILQKKRIEYYGDPLRDFGLPHFLERFVFKNPKKIEDGDSKETHHHHQRSYVAFGSRGRPVRSLRRDACTEDEMFIFNFLESKRLRSVPKIEKKSGSKDHMSDEDEGEVTGLKATDVDDEEFENYLDGFFGKKASKKSGLNDEGDNDDAVDEDDDDELDFLKELMANGNMKQSGGTKKDKKTNSKQGNGEADNDYDLDDVDADWGNDENSGDEEMKFDSAEDGSDDDRGSIEEFEETDDDDDDNGELISMDEVDDDGSGSDYGSDDDNDTPPKAKKPRKGAHNLDDRSFAKKLKHSTDMNSLFAAADDFSELLSEGGQTRGHGTLNAVYNKDKSSEKQMRWEERRRSNSKTYTSGKPRKHGGNKNGKSKKQSKHF